MVDPISDEERRSVTTQIKVGFVVLVALSAGLITLQGDPSLLVVVAALVAGAVVGVLLVWLIFPGTGETARRPRR